MTLYFWFIPYVHVRVSGENLGTTLFLLGLVLLQNLKKNRSHFYRNSIIAGILIAAAIQLRFHIGIIGLSWLIWNWKLAKNYGPFILSALGTTALCSFIDYWGYEETWTFPPYNYFYHNIILDRASGFGIMPWYGYFQLFSQKLTTPLGVFISFTLITFWLVRPKDNLTALTLPFFLIHSFVPHKEIRFLIPLIPFILLIATHVYDWFIAKIENRYSTERNIVLGGFALYFTFYMAGASLFAANESFGFLKKWNNYPFPHQAMPILIHGRENPFYPYGLTSYTLLKNSPPQTLHIKKYEDFVLYLNQHLDRLTNEGIYLYSSERPFIKYVTYHHPECRAELTSASIFNSRLRRSISILLKCKK